MYTTRRKEIARLHGDRFGFHGPRGGGWGGARASTLEVLQLPSFLPRQRAAGLPVAGALKSLASFGKYPTTAPSLKPATLRSPSTTDRRTRRWR